MSKLIKITPEALEEACTEFRKALSETKFLDGRITYSKTLETVERKATIYFSEEAWLKMQALIKEFSDEIAWHGIASRGASDEDKDEYIISDILVYPQVVTGATVTTDQEEYQTWLMSQDDAVFNNIRMQGHSHVNMGTSPSGVDTTSYEKIIEQLDDDMFYIFMIWNKKGDKSIRIYDIERNVLFDTPDIEVKVLDGDYCMEAFLNSAKDAVKKKSLLLNPKKKNKDKSKTQKADEDDVRKTKEKASYIPNETFYPSYWPYASEEDYRDPFYARGY